jgi:hypothetical protein
MHHRPSIDNKLLINQRDCHQQTFQLYEIEKVAPGNAAR